MSEFTPPFSEPVRDSAGCPIPFAQLSFFETGTTVAKNVYADEWLNVPLTQPVQADRYGRTPRIFFDGFTKVEARTKCGDLIHGYPVDPVLCDGVIPKYTLSQVESRVFPAIFFWVTDVEPMELRVGDCETEGGVVIFTGDRKASTTVCGLVELATIAEAVDGTDTVRAVTPAGLSAAIEAALAAFIPKPANGVGQSFNLVCTADGWTVEPIDTSGANGDTIPAGGTEGQYLTRNASGVLEWRDLPASGGSSAPTAAQVKALFETDLTARTSSDPGGFENYGCFEGDLGFTAAVGGGGG